VKKIYDSLNMVDINDLRMTDCYFKEENVFIRVYLDSVVITDLTDALKHGKKCKSYIIRPTKWDPQRSLLCDFFNILSDWDFSIAEFVEKLRSGESLFWLENQFNIEHREEKATRIYSPFAEVKPIKKPSKWTIPHVWKAILAKQVKQAKCTGYYTDDYAGDAACNFRQGGISPEGLAEKIIKSPSGWRVYVEKETEDEVVLRVNCHHFDNNRVIIDVSKIA